MCSSRFIGKNACSVDGAPKRYAFMFLWKGIGRMVDESELATLIRRVTLLDDAKGERMVSRHIQER